MTAPTPFPPRHAGKVLAEAMSAADAAAAAEAARLRHLLLEPWGGRSMDPGARAAVEAAALSAALPILRGLTSDPAMREIVAHGMAAEAMIRLGKRGAA